MFLNEGHKKDNNSGIRQGARNAITRIDVEKSESHIVFMIQKAEKLTTAIYLITDFLDTKESFRWKIRDSALSFLSFINNLKYGALISEKEHDVKKAISSLFQITSLLDLALSIRFISQMNYSILKDEYQDLYNTLCSELQTNKPKDNLFFPQGFFEIQGQNKGHPIKDNHKGQNKAINVLNNKDLSLVNVANNGIETIEKNSNNLLISTKKTERQETILRFLKSRGDASIKDIVNVISGCGEKTVQRELLSLIKNGIICKIGERRWSKYALVAQAL
ncbi:MAG: hypothetical protein Q8R36_02930 [bacterium]|nr:hypothetical protein [bacterium]